MRRVRIVRMTILFVALFATWLVLSQRFDPLFITAGIVVALFAMATSAQLLELTLGELQHHPQIRLHVVALFVPWLLGRIMLGSVHVVGITLSSSRRPDPDLVEFRTELTTPAARTVLAHSITLVPGTVVVDTLEHELYVHVFTPHAIDDVLTGKLQNFIARMLKDDEQPVPELHWLGGLPEIWRSP